jgi:hypothetical protein
VSEAAPHHIPLPRLEADLHIWEGEADLFGRGRQTYLGGGGRPIWEGEADLFGMASFMNVPLPPLPTCGWLGTYYR